MRTILFLLVLANLVLYGYTQIDTGTAGEGARLAQQVKPDAIKVLTPQQVAALGPAKVAALADVCIDWGPFSDADRARALSDLETLALGRLLTQKRVDTSVQYWVYVPAVSTKSVADRRAADLVAQGLRNVAVVNEGGPQRFTISLGAFRTEDGANAYLQQLAQRGIGDAEAGPRPQILAQTRLVVRDPEAMVVQRIKSLQPSYPGTDIRIGTCEKSA